MWKFNKRVYVRPCLFIHTYIYIVYTTHTCSRYIDASGNTVYKVLSKECKRRNAKFMLYCKLNCKLGIQRCGITKPCHLYAMLHRTYILVRNTYINMFYIEIYHITDSIWMHMNICLWILFVCYGGKVLELNIFTFSIFCYNGIQINTRLWITSMVLSVPKSRGIMEKTSKKSEFVYWNVEFPAKVPLLAKSISLIKPYNLFRLKL